MKKARKLNLTRETLRKLGYEEPVFYTVHGGGPVDTDTGATHVTVSNTATTPGSRGCPV